MCLMKIRILYYCDKSRQGIGGVVYKSKCWKLWGQMKDTNKNKNKKKHKKDLFGGGGE